MILLLVTLCLLVSIPIYWLIFRRFFLEPLNRLTTTMQAIQKGDTNTRVSRDSRLQEVNEIAWTVNTMLDALQQQKISSYEQQLETKHAQLQYLQLQIRPHFYLNCLNMIYSMAEEKNNDAIQELVLSLSSYLRNMFRDSSKLISLSAELRSVESYIRIQQMGTQQKPQFRLELDAEVTEVLIPPLSILTFVENSFKHNKTVDAPPEIRIKCGKLFSEEGHWLNITVCDNCGGISEDHLQRLNGTCEDMYREKHVGIFNVKQRLHFIYGDKAVLSFRNQTGGVCVDLFFPMDQDGAKEVFYDRSIGR
jgi:two-component system sensor histidine kinase YesM